MKIRKIIPVALPEGLVLELDKLVKEGEFMSRSEALKFGARLVVMMSRRIHVRTEDYAYEEIKEGVLRGKRAHVS
ncbi:CopG family transcriptional regulator [Candidatus Pacearchaeota archaeon]|nr:CopG family transcriptional regulator [Candidatus Pacearchaeota archaeon]